MTEGARQALDDAQVAQAKATMFELAGLARAHEPTVTTVVLEDSDQGDWLWVRTLLLPVPGDGELEYDDYDFDDDGCASNLYTDVWMVRDLMSQYDARGAITHDRSGTSFHMDVAKVLNELAPTPVERPGITLTRDQVEAWVGHTLTDEQVDDLEEAIPNSSVPDAVETIAHEALNIPYPTDEKEFRS